MTFFFLGCSHTTESAVVPILGSSRPKVLQGELPVPVVVPVGQDLGRAILDTTDLVPPESTTNPAFQNWSYPVQNPVIRKKFGLQDGWFLAGIDLESDSQSRIVFSVSSGTVLVAGPCDERLCVLISHEDSRISVYEGISDIVVSKGMKVGAGEEIGRIARGSVFHFEIRNREGVPFDPEKVLVASPDAPSMIALQKDISEFADSPLRPSEEKATAQIMRSSASLGEHIRSVSGELRGRAPKVLQRELVENVSFWIRYTTTGKRWSRTNSRRQRFKGVIAEALRRNRLPGLFTAIPWVESGFESTALSPAGARGLWQLMPATARQYGLTVNGKQDERVLPDMASAAATAYLRDLLVGFGHDAFLFAIAAYNCGESCVWRRSVKTGVSRWSNDEFWRVYPALPLETRGYVARVLATMIAMRALEPEKVAVGGR